MLNYLAAPALTGRDRRLAARPVRAFTGRTPTHLMPAWRQALRRRLSI